eukprot:CAMPEP_0178984720 /NCGR_PEP_ID=MMETSP0795-20121207/1768_1 /TAXON_ID=88552 /ORGANISM="Amoebophrya sp., Strain Ameob2" /LENGTH=173 /DNA_ID=CAMNT_0020675627 /DNA_START=546 /DNA_END=1071 /DNA_ORIENTATION=+
MSPASSVGPEPDRIGHSTSSSDRYKRAQNPQQQSLVFFAAPDARMSDCPPALNPASFDAPAGASNEPEPPPPFDAFRSALEAFLFLLPERLPFEPFLWPSEPLLSEDLRLARDPSTASKRPDITWTVSCPIVDCIPDSSSASWLAGPASAADRRYEGSCIGVTDPSASCPGTS